MAIKLCKIWSKRKWADEKIQLGKRIRVLTFTCQHLPAGICGGAHPPLALGSRWEIVWLLSLPTRRSCWEKKGSQGTLVTSSKLSLVHHRAPRLRGKAIFPRTARCVLCSNQVHHSWAPASVNACNDLWGQKGPHPVKSMFCAEGLRDSWLKQTKRQLVKSISGMLTRQTRVGSDSGQFHLGNL